MVVKPVLILLIAFGINFALCAFIPALSSLPVFLNAAVQIGFISLVYGGMLVLFHKRSENPGQLCPFQRAELSGIIRLFLFFYYARS